MVSRARTYRSTMTTSNGCGGGGKPLSKWALTVARTLPNRATVVGMPKAPSTSAFVMTRSTVAEDRSPGTRNSVIWLRKFWTAHSRPASNRIPSTFGRSSASRALAPVEGFTEYTAALLLWATIRVEPSGVAAMPLRLKPGVTSPAGPLTTRVEKLPTEPSSLIGTRYRWGWTESVNHAAPPATITSLMIEPGGVPNWYAATSAPVR